MSSPDVSFKFTQQLAFAGGAIGAVFAVVQLVARICMVMTSDMATVQDFRGAIESTVEDFFGRLIWLTLVVIFAIAVSRPEVHAFAMAIYGRGKQSDMNAQDTTDAPSPVKPPYPCSKSEWPFEGFENVATMPELTVPEEPALNTAEPAYVAENADKTIEDKEAEIAKLSEVISILGGEIQNLKGQLNLLKVKFSKEHDDKNRTVSTFAETIAALVAGGFIQKAALDAIIQGCCNKVTQGWNPAEQNKPVGQYLVPEGGPEENDSANWFNNLPVTEVSSRSGCKTTYIWMAVTDKRGSRCATEKMLVRLEPVVNCA